MERRELVFRVFVSSTFSDLKVERNVLQAVVFPQLREHCKNRGARFQAIDLRWGVSQEAALDQQTMSICHQELQRCQEMSPKPNFIILLGNRYGWRPLPARIPAEEFEEILKAVPSSEQPRLVTGEDVLPWVDGQRVERFGWYRRDDNAVPPEYVLQPRTVDLPQGLPVVERKRILEEEGKDWLRIENEIRTTIAAAMDRLGWDEAAPCRLRHTLSATHQEIEHGALNQELDAEDHVFAYFRDIPDLPASADAVDFRDMQNGRVDAHSAACLNGLKEEIRTRLPQDNIFEYDIGWAEVSARNADPSSIDVDNLPNDLRTLCDRVRDNLLGVIDREIDSYQREDEMNRERRAHRDFAAERGQHFIGRGDLLARIADYVGGKGDNKPLVIHGVSGTGKTALMARAWLTLTNPDETVACFIGATPGSADLRTLLRGLCMQLGVENPPSDMNELVRAFRERFTGSEEGAEGGGQPAQAVVFLDALDQLNPTDNARMLYWLPRELAPGVKLIVSTLTDEGAQGEGYDILKRLWPDHMEALEGLTPDDGAELLDRWLREVERTLQPEQRKDIIGKFERDQRPLYLKLAFEEARLWKSWEGLPCGADDIPGLSEDLGGILMDLFHRQEDPRNHGRILVEHALGNIAAAKSGLTEEELLDVLSRDEAVMSDYIARNPASPDVDRLPVVIWARLHADLKPYMTQRRADGTVVMNFYHRQVAEAAIARYFGDSEELRLAAHDRLADYFHSLDYWAESLEDQRARAKRLPPTPRPANIRKVVELPYHRLEAAKLGGKDDPKSPYWDAVADLLTDWQFLEAKAEADPTGKYAAEQAASASASPPGGQPA